MQVLLSTLCLALTSAVLCNAWYQKKQFYPAVVYVTKSNASMAVMYIQFFAMVFLFGKLLRKVKFYEAIFREHVLKSSKYLSKQIFLGQLRAAEFEHLLERFWYALTETCLAFTVFRDDFNPRFVALFTVLLFLKSFHWLAEERVDYMERSPVLGWLFHLRVASLLIVLGTVDYLLVLHAYNSTLQRGPTVQLVFGFEYAILLTVIASTTTKYLLHTSEMRTDTPWENKAVFLLYTELLIGLIKVILYVLFVVIMAKFYALPMFVFRPMFFTIRSFKKALNDVIMSRRAIRNMNTLYPDASPEELRLSDNICIICREDMINHAKKLPCGHIFHTACLRSWFQRQQTCPTCRLNILRTPVVNSTAMPPNTNENTGNNMTASAVRNTSSNNLRNSQSFSRQTNTDPSNIATPVNTLHNSSELSNTTNDSTTAATGQNFVGLPLIPPPSFMIPPPFPFISPYAVPTPPMPNDLTQLSDEELKVLEGHERKNIEERLKLLKNIQSMLDAAGILMNNYQIIAARTQQMGNKEQGTLNSATSTTTNDGPSTSKAAAAAAAEAAVAATVTTTDDAIHATSLQKETQNIQQCEMKKASSTNNPTIVCDNDVELTNNCKYNQVTIEDLDAEEQEENAASPTSVPQYKAEIEVSTEHINELRKRRLKFLEERNKTTSKE